jgi:hypothetical protein
LDTLPSAGSQKSEDTTQKKNAESVTARADVVVD